MISLVLRGDALARVNAVKKYTLLFCLAFKLRG